MFSYFQGPLGRTFWSRWKISFVFCDEFSVVSFSFNCSCLLPSPYICLVLSSVARESGLIAYMHIRRHVELGYACALDQTKKMATSNRK